VSPAGRRRVVLVGAGVALLTGCATPVSLRSELVACAEGDDGAPANGVILMAQSVPSAGWVPCLDSMPVGWHFADLDAHSDAARFWLDSDEYGVHAIEVQLTASCDTAGATEIRSDRLEMRRLEKVTQVTPQFVGRRFYLFDGGCIAVVFRLSGMNSAEPLGVATQAIGVVRRNELRDLVREKSDGRLELDPAGADGPP
jgi:hypothetical protein